MTRTPDIPPVIESDEREYRDTGIPSTVAIAGHPIHPVIVTLPIAFLVALPLTDIVYLLTQDAFWARASFWLVLAGFVTSIAAALTGLMDFLKIERVRKRTAGWAHMFLNVAAMALTLINLILRWGNVTGAILPTGVILSILVATILGASGWYGGELVYRHKIAVIGYGNPHEP